MGGLSSQYGNQKPSGRSISRILSSNKLPGRSSLWAACRHVAQCGLPGTGTLPVESAHKETSSLPPSADDFVPAWPCSRQGLPGRAHYCTRRWSFTPPFHPYRPLRGSGLFLWPFPAGSRLAADSPPRVLPDAVPYGVRTFLDPDNAGPRSPDRPEVLSSYSHHTRTSIAGEG
jgi:hypothetical protein